MDGPQTKKQQRNRDKATMEYKRAGKGARAIEKNQELSIFRNYPPALQSALVRKRI